MRRWMIPLLAATVWLARPPAAGADPAPTTGPGQGAPPHETQAGPTPDARSKTMERNVSRIPLLKPDELTPEQREAYERSPGGKMNLSLLLDRAPTIWPGFSQMAQAVFTKLAVP
ncbi:MAG: hypothetical protein JO303_11510, partial [Caulobacteraceae bacterium]|nr:hypothetical protein [Caulobacteraceae bacterium]